VVAAAMAWAFTTSWNISRKRAAAACVLELQSKRIGVNRAPRERDADLFFKMDPRASRIDKLRSIPPGHLLLVAREWVLNGYNNNTSVTHVTRVLESSASRCDKESCWLLDKLRTVPKFGSDWNAKMRWIAEIMAVEADHSPWAQYYRGRALWILGGGGDSDLTLVMQAAEAGFAPAMSFVAYMSGKEEGTAWLRKTAALNDAEGLWRLAVFDEDKTFELLRAAAAQGHAYSMRMLVEQYEHRLSKIEVATFYARCMLLSGDCGFNSRLVYNAVVEHDVDVMCAVGCELEGYSSLWDNGRHPDKSPNKSIWPCTDVYLTVMHRARRAALQTASVLVRHLGRDVTTLIAKAVYQTRTTTPRAWWFYL
jgi:hypothetical protein